MSSQRGSEARVPVVVGLGASAGGLEPLEEFFVRTPADSGCAYVVVQHLDRRRPSQLADLLARHTRMPVRQAQDQDEIGAGRVYVTAPDCELKLEGNRLRVSKSCGADRRRPIDHFFLSLAAERGELAVGVVLSGTNDDGTLGLKAIKDQGGLTLAQDPYTARFSAMPAGAIQAGCVDDVLEVKEMPARLAAYVRSLASRLERGAGPGAHLGVRLPCDDRQAFEHMMLDEHCLPAALVDARGEILCSAGRLDTFLCRREGLIGNNLLERAAPRLRQTLQTALAEASASRATVVRRIGDPRGGSAGRELRVTVRPAPQGAEEPAPLAVVFELVETAGSAPVLPAHAAGESSLVAQLQGDLAAVRADLKAAIEDLESTSDALSSSNEELATKNEELATTNEELRSANDELRAAQDELQSVNDELRRKVHDLDVANGDLQNLFTGTQIATVLLDRELRLSRFTPAAAPLLHLTDADLGRPLADLASPFPGVDLVADASHVIDEPGALEREVQVDGAWLAVRVMPYRNLENVIAGAVVTFTDVTRLKRSEEDLRASEARYRGLVEMAPDAIFVNRGNRITLVNPAALRLFGATSPEQILGKSPLELFHPDYHHLVRSRIEALTAGQDVPLLEEKIVRLDGEVRDVEVAAASGASRAGWAHQVVLRDITERKRAEDALRTSRADLNRAQAVAATGSWRLDIGRNELKWSDEAYRIFGLPIGTPMTYETFLAQVHPEDRDQVDRQWRAALAGEEYDIEHRILVDGQVKWVRERAELELDEDGRLRAGFGTVQNITERRHADGELQYSLRRFELLAQTASELLQAGDPQAVVDSLCRKVLAHLDCQVFFNFLVDPEAGRLRLNACAGIPEQDLAKVAWLDYGTAVCGCVAREGCRIVAEHIPATPDPRTELVKSFGVKAYACHPLLGPGGKVIGTLSFGTRHRETFSPDDLSLMKAVTDQVAVAMVRMQAEEELRRSEDALRRANEGLEQRVRDRTAELAMMVTTLQGEVEQREQAEESLKVANEQLNARAEQLRALAGELTLTEQRERRRMAQMLHDHLQQLLVGARLRVSVLAHAGGAAVNRAAAEIEDLLAESIDASRSLTSELSPPILHEGDLAVSLEWLARWMADKHGLDVDLSIEEDLPELSEDVKVLLFEAVRELLFNAVKHAQVPSVRVGLKRSGVALEIEVSDSGRGFEPDRLKPAGEIGGGFGLFSVRERLELVGGRMVIVSAPGKGSRFTLTVPLGRAPVAGTAEGVGPSAGPEPPPPGVAPAAAGAKIRVLVADDHAVAREGLVRVLGQEADIEIVGQAADGGEAVALAARLAPDVILMDVSMPRMNGIKATRAIHADAPAVRIIGLSMFEEAERAKAMRAAGAVCYLTKSSPAADIIGAIRAVTQGRAPARKVSRQPQPKASRRRRPA